VSLTDEITKAINLIKEVEADAPKVLAALADFETKLHATPFLSVIESKIPAVKVIDDDMVKFLSFLSSLEASTLPYLPKILDILNSLVTVSA
jgi:hypothetical protein